MWRVKTEQKSTYLIDALNQWRNKRLSVNVDTRYRIFRGYELGRGSFGKVYKARDKGTMAYVAVKEAISSAENAEIQREVDMYSAIGTHGNVMSMLGQFSINSANAGTIRCLALNYCQLSLRDIANSPSHVHIKSHRIKVAAYELLRGLNYLHGKGLVHCDLKPANILVDAHGTIKISDLGGARAAFHANLPKVVTRPYRPPEAALQNVALYSKNVDIWSAACTIYELISRGHWLFNTADVEDEDDGTELFTTIASVMGDPTPEELQAICPPLRQVNPTGHGSHLTETFQSHHVPDHAADMLRKMLRYNPASRISALEALTSRYFDTLRLHAKSNKQLFDFDLSELGNASSIIIEKLIPETMRSSAVKNHLDSMKQNPHQQNL